MKLYKSILAAAALTMGAAGLTGCQDNFDDWDLSAPVADIKANTTILELKQTFWKENDNYCVEIPAREDGSHYIVSGRVISSDRESNVFKCLYIQDETAALPISINQYSLYVNNRIGQEIVIDLTGLHCGRYSGMFQIGALDYDEKTGDAGTTFLDPEIFMLHRQLNGNPDPSKIDTLVVEDVSSMSGDLMKWQGQLVRYNNATFTNGKSTTNNQLCNEYHSSGYNQELTGSFGSLNVRTSGYSTFWNEKIPAEACDVVGIQGYYSGSSPWQLTLNDYQGIMNVGDPTAEGIKTKPYTVERAIELSAADNVTGWVKGYIVGTIRPEITTVSSNADIQWIGEEPYIVDDYLVIASTPETDPETRDYTKCILVPLADPSALYEYGNLVENPDLAGRTLNIRGRFSKNMGMAYIAGNDGAPTSFVIEGVDVPGSEDPELPGDGDGSEANPFTVAQGIAQSGGTGWVKGYIVGVNSGSPDYTFVAVAPFSIASNVYIADSPTETNTAKMMPIQLVAGSDIRKAVNLMDNPGNIGKVLSIEGSFEKYFSQMGLKSPTAYKLDGQGSGDTPTPPSGGSGTGTETDPYNIAAAIANQGGSAWVKGYIVGCMNSNANYTMEVTAPFTVASNVYLADNASETNTANMLPVQLVANTDIRTAVNLVDNPGNHGKMLAIQGSLEAYFKQPGLKAPTAYKLDGQGGDTPTPPADTEGEGTETKPYTVGDVLGLNNPGTTAWVEGYIVGTSVGSGGAFEPLNFTATDPSKTNLLLAATPGETDPSKLVPVQLPSGDIRTALNLADNPAHLGKKITLQGTLSAYFNRPGVRTVTTYKF